MCYRPYGFPGTEECEPTSATEFELRDIEPCAVYVVTVMSVSPSGLLSEPLKFYVNTDEAGASSNRLSYLVICLTIIQCIYLSIYIPLLFYVNTEEAGTSSNSLSYFVICLTIIQFIYLSIFLFCFSIHLPLSTYQSILFSAYILVYLLSIYLSICLAIHEFVYLFMSLSINLLLST